MPGASFSGARTIVLLVTLSLVGNVPIGVNSFQLPCTGPQAIRNVAVTVPTRTVHRPNRHPYVSVPACFRGGVGGVLPFSSSSSSSSSSRRHMTFWDMDRSTAEALAGPLFGASLLPYLGFLYWLDVPENGDQTPKGVTVGFATCLLFVFLTVPAAIAAQLWYGVSLADSDWLHGSAESLLTITNLVTVLAFRRALGEAKVDANANANDGTAALTGFKEPSSTSYAPMVQLVAILTAVAGLTALVPAVTGAGVHTPYLNGFMDLPPNLWQTLVGRSEPDNALTVACWIIHVSSLVEFLVAMGFCWRWADVVNNPRWKGLTWGLLPLHSSGITACTYHLFYNGIPVLVPIQAALTCVGNTTAMYAAYRIAVSNGWIWIPPANWSLGRRDAELSSEDATVGRRPSVSVKEKGPSSSSSLIGFEDLGEALAADDDLGFVAKLFLGCAVASYAIKYGETVLFPEVFKNADVGLGLAVVLIPSALNAYKWYRRSGDPTFEGWF